MNTCIFNLQHLLNMKQREGGGANFIPTHCLLGKGKEGIRNPPLGPSVESTVLMRLRTYRTVIDYLVIYKKRERVEVERGWIEGFGI